MLADTADTRGYIRRERMKNDEISEPYTCPECFAVRRAGGRCPTCGYVANQRTRRVVQVNGMLKTMEGKMFRKTRSAGENAREMWMRTFWSQRKNGKTFRQAFASFGYKCRENLGYYAKPSPDWPFIPNKVVDEIKRIKDVPFSNLVPAPEKDLKNDHHQSRQRKLRGIAP